MVTRHDGAVLTRRCMEEPDRDSVLAAVKQAFPYDWEDVFERMQWSYIDGNWCIDYKGIFVGIEPDGYIHS